MIRKSGDLYKYEIYVLSLRAKEIEKIIQTKDKILSRSEIISKDKIVSELSFGFWTALFQSVYDDKMRFNKKIVTELL